MTAPEPETQKRAFASHTPKWQRFQTSMALSSVKTSESILNVYQRQYSHVYANRLSELKPRCFDNAPEKDGVARCERVLDLQEDETSLVVGTVIKEFGNEKAFEGSNCRPNDSLVLEDESGRVNLKVDQPHSYATGAVLAVEGVVKSDGYLHVETVYPPTLPKSVTIKGQLRNSSNELAPHVMLLSGLQCGDLRSSTLQRDMLLAYLQGQLTKTAAKICHIIVAGGSTSHTGTKDMDAFLAQTCAAGIPVDLLPGMNDPTTANWPQRPIHSSLVKETDAFETLLFKTPNPYASALGGKLVLGTDGRNVSDLVQFLRKDDAPVSELEALETTLRWCHMCPTGPDSVPTRCHPESDPMIVPFMPHLYFAGNCTKFNQKLFDDTTRLVCIPQFSMTGECVLVNLETMKCELLRFDDSY